MNISCQEQCPPRSSPAAPHCHPQHSEQGWAQSPEKRAGTSSAAKKKRHEILPLHLHICAANRERPQINSRCYFSADLFVCHSSLRNLGTAWAVGTEWHCPLSAAPREPAAQASNPEEKCQFLPVPIKKENKIKKKSHPEVPWKVCVL